MSLIEPPVYRFSGDSIRLRRSPNGGWVIYTQAYIPGNASEVIASFSDTDDMLAWLGKELKDFPEEFKPDAGKLK